MNEFTYAEYRNILSEIKKTGRVTDFSRASTSDEFCILRHDVEWSLSKALQMAKIEAEEGIESIYFIQFESDCYNPFSEENKEKVRSILSYGHQIGLHYRQKESANASQEILQQSAIMADQYSTDIRCFSIHRPRNDSDYNEIKAGNLINSYSFKYFTRTENTKCVDVKYITDSKLKWRYGYPSYEMLKDWKRIQILIHPFGWSDTKADMKTIFENLLQEKRNETKQVFHNEFSRFVEIEGTIK